MTVPFNPYNWYWFIGDDETRVYSSARSNVVAVDDAIYLAWLANSEAVPSRRDSMELLVDVLRSANVPPYHVVSKRAIVDRLQTAGKLVAARAAMDAADLYLRELWNASSEIHADVPEMLAMLNAIGVDPSVILAP